jgi:CheY-like chemotaxis protein
VQISLTDTGIGMDDSVRERIFDPFFTTKKMGRGTGLGLASVYGIIKNHSGIIIVESEPGRGSTFNIYLPASEKRAEEINALDEKIFKGIETVLLIDDEESILEVGKDLLEKLGYKVFIANSGAEALEIYEKLSATINIVVLDMIMPGMSGGETFDRLKQANPKLKALLSSGYSIDGQATEILKRGCNGFIQKPFKVDEISRKLREILDKPDM